MEVVTAAPREEFGDWVRPHLVAMARLAARLAPGEADDVVQEALARAWRRRETYVESRGTAQAWLLAIVADRARRTWRRRSPVPVAEVPDAAAADRTADVDLERALARLPRRQRLAVDLHYFVGLSVAEAAAVLGCAEGTVTSALYDARARLRKELGDDD
jgi:RNA polymerase sigma factor (sigma-70 family)